MPIAEHAVVLIEVIVGKQAVPDIFQLAEMCVVLLDLLHGFLKFVLGVGSQCAIGAGTCEKVQHLRFRFSQRHRLIGQDFFRQQTAVPLKINQPELFQLAVQIVPVHGVPLFRQKT